MAFTVSGGTQAAPITPANIVAAHTQATFGAGSGNKALYISETMVTANNAYIDLTGVDIYFTAGTLKNIGTGAVIKYGSETAGRITPGGTIHILDSGLGWTEAGSIDPLLHSIAGKGKLEWYGVVVNVYDNFFFMQGASGVQHILKKCVLNANKSQQLFWSAATTADSGISANGYMQLLSSPPKFDAFRSKDNTNAASNGSPNLIGTTQSSSLEFNEFSPNVGTGENLRIGNQANNIVQEMFFINSPAAKTIFENIIFWGNASALKTGAYLHTDIVLDIKDYAGTNEILSVVGVTDSTGTIRKTATTTRRPNRAASTSDNLVSGETTDDAIITTTNTAKTIRVQTLKNTFVGTGSAAGTSGTVVDTSSNTVTIRNYNYNEEKQIVSSLALTNIRARLQEDVNVTRSAADAAALLYHATNNPTGISIDPDRQEDNEHRPAIIVRKTGTTKEEIYDAWKAYHTTEANFIASKIELSVVNGKLKLGDYTNRTKYFEILLDGNGSIDLTGSTKFSGFAPDSQIDFGQPANNIETLNGGNVTGYVLIDIPATLTGVTADLKDNNVVVWIDTAGSYTLTSWDVLNQNGTGKIILMIRAANVSISTNIPSAVLVNGNAVSGNVATWKTFTATHAATIEQGDSLDYSSKALTSNDTIVLSYGYAVAADGTVTNGTILGKKAVTAAEATAKKVIVPYKYTPAQTGDDAVTVRVVRGATFNAAGDTLTAGKDIRADQLMTAGRTKAVSDDASIEQTAEAVVILNEVKPKIEATQTVAGQAKTIASDTNKALKEFITVESEGEQAPPQPTS